MNEYEQKSRYWETVKIFEKMFIILAQINFSSQMKEKGISIFLILFIYTINTQRLKPYSNKTINSMEVYSSLICSCSILIAVIINQKYITPAFKYILITLLCCINGLFLIIWLALRV